MFLKVLLLDGSQKILMLLKVKYFQKENKQKKTIHQVT